MVEGSKSLLLELEFSEKSHHGLLMVHIDPIFKNVAKVTTK